MTNEHPAIERDPSLEAVLYQPSGRINRPLTDSFYRACFASGAITPPLGEGANVRRSDFILGCTVCAFVVAGIGAFILGIVWR